MLPPSDGMKQHRLLLLTYLLSVVFCLLSGFQAFSTFRLDGERRARIVKRSLFSVAALAQEQNRNVTEAVHSIALVRVGPPIARTGPVPAATSPLPSHSRSTVGLVKGGESTAGQALLDDHDHDDSEELTETAQDVLLYRQQLEYRLRELQEIEITSDSFGELSEHQLLGYHQRRRPTNEKHSVQFYRRAGKHRTFVHNKVSVHMNGNSGTLVQKKAQEESRSSSSSPEFNNVLSRSSDSANPLPVIIQGKPDVDAEKKSLVDEVLAQRHNYQTLPPSKYNHASPVERVCKATTGKIGEPGNFENALTKAMEERLLRHLFYDDDMEAVFCVVPRLGNSLHSATSHVWDYILQEVADKFQFHNSSYSLKPLGHLAMPEIRDRLRAYYKLAIVQHPVHRLVSLYGELSSHLTDNHTLNKLNSSVPATGDNTTQEQDPSWQGMSPERILTEAGNASGNVTYRSVMQFLAKRGPVLTGDDWMPVTDLCQPCVVQYHFIAKVEELPQSAVHALQAIGIADEVTSPVRSEMTTLANTSVVNHLNSELTVKEFYDVQNAYHLDCQLFSYVAKPPAFL
ncbi:uncharacterized protein LOC135810059 [Sycon ciliatum]|uniref:uncharacterized protein LOC135810059 n=1 Tax=Sycon ciliatum TaxID=27933 RepID=UPI0031F65449